AEPLVKETKSGFETDAFSAVLLDENGVILYEKNPHEKLPPASVTKIMTLLLAIEAVESGKISLDDKVKTSKNAHEQGGSQIWLEVGEELSVHELLIAVAVVSANDAAMAILEHIYGTEENGVMAMNDKAKSLGLLNTNFVNPNGLPAEDHYMSAYDAALIAREAIKHPLYMELCSIKEYWLREDKNWLVNTNKLLWWYEGADGLKTGWTQDAKYCFVGTAKRSDLRLISVIFKSEEPRSHLRESMRLLDWGYSNFVAVPIIKKGSVVDRVRVSRGNESELEVVAACDLNVTIAKKESKNIEQKVIKKKNLRGPIAKGEKCGELVVFKDSIEIARVDLLAAKDIEKAGFLKIFQDMMNALFR
ncbi:D-alanyl-D-alanine carboxypeptidase, partial [Selenomonadales bacterium OttesenSCG-928-I06]|nr:D-alanyl-D-alanine carboxypeptidase [Selenomonadales bacterium OttesenSCG-928-I06]